MKKNITNVSVMLLAVVLLMFTGCTKKEKTFSKDGITVTLTEDFVENELVTANLYLVSTKNIFMGLKENFTDLAKSNINSNSSLNDYAEVIISVNSLTSEIKTNIEGDITLTYLVYTKTMSDKDYTFMAVFKKGAASFYMFNFACETKNYEDSEEQYFTWARTITVE